jgi:hypothetical protein
MLVRAKVVPAEYGELAMAAISPIPESTSCIRREALSYRLFPESQNDLGPKV